MTLRSAKDVRGYSIQATDDTIGHVEDFFFDDEMWALRYFVVNTGNWLFGRNVLISPLSVQGVDWANQRVDVALTRQQVKDSPDIATDRPVSRQQELEYLRYYNYTPYWGGGGIWGAAGMYPPAPAYPNAITPSAPETTGTQREIDRAIQAEEAAQDKHLRSANEVHGYHIQASDGEIGHISDFIFDDANWAIRYLVIDTRNWWPGKKVLLPPSWAHEINWPDRLVHIDLRRDTIKAAPEYEPDTLLNREFENRFYRHYQQLPYWETEQG